MAKDKKEANEEVKDQVSEETQSEATEEKTEDKPKEDKPKRGRKKAADKKEGRPAWILTKVLKETDGKGKNIVQEIAFVKSGYGLSAARNHAGKNAGSILSYEIKEGIID